MICILYDILVQLYPSKGFIVTLSVAQPTIPVRGNLGIVSDHVLRLPFVTRTRLYTTTFANVLIPELRDGQAFLDIVTGIRGSQVASPVFPADGRTMRVVFHPCNTSESTTKLTFRDFRVVRSVADPDHVMVEERSGHLTTIAMRMHDLLLVSQEMAPA